MNCSCGSHPLEAAEILNTLSLWSSAFSFLHEYGIRNNTRQADGLMKIYVGIACMRSCYYRCSVVVVVPMVFLNSCFQAWMVEGEFWRRLMPLCSASWGLCTHVALLGLHSLALHLFHHCFLPRFYYLDTACKITTWCCQVWYKQGAILISCILPIVTGVGNT